MTDDDGPERGSSQIGDALVAALGFEPTDSVEDDETVQSERPVLGSTGNGGTGGDGSADGNGNGSVSTELAPTGELLETVIEPSAVADALTVPTVTSQGVAPTDGLFPTEGALPTPGGSASETVASAGAALAAENASGGRQSASTLTDAESSGVRPIAAKAGAGVVPVMETSHALTADAEFGRSAVAEMSTQPVVSPSVPYVGETVGTPPLIGASPAQPAVAPNGSVEKASGLATKLPHLLESGLLRRSRRVRARKVRRVVRHIDPWSVLTFSVLFHLAVFAALLLASVLVWNAAVAAGTIENIESFIRELGDYTEYEIQGDVVFRAAMAIAAIMTLASTVMVVLLTVVFNLISDLIGGIRVTVVEEETVRVHRKRNQ